MCKENWKSVTDMENCVYWRRRRRQVWVFSDPLSWNIIRPDTKVPGLLKSFNPSFHLSINSFVACTRLFNPLCLTVGRSVILCFFGVFVCFCTTVTAQIYQCIVGLIHHCPCPSACDLGSHVSSLVLS